MNTKCSNHASRRIANHRLAASPLNTIMKGDADMKKLHTSMRIALLGALFVLICVFYAVVLVNVQITGQDYYTIIKEDRIWVI